MDKNKITGLDDTDESDVTPAEKAMLEETMTNADLGDDDGRRIRAELDDTDFDGELLNEKSSADDVAGDDLDVPGADLDDDNEAIGEEDEENNDYSIADTD